MHRRDKARASRPSRLRIIMKMMTRPGRLAATANPFSNWLNYVYQQTPYEIESIPKSGGQVWGHRQ